MIGAGNIIVIHQEIGCRVPSSTIQSSPCCIVTAFWSVLHYAAWWQRGYTLCVSNPTPHTDWLCHLSFFGGDYVTFTPVCGENLTKARSRIRNNPLCFVGCLEAAAQENVQPSKRNCGLYVVAQKVNFYLVITKSHLKPSN